jgi:hypothetical protein
MTKRRKAVIAACAALAVAMAAAQGCELREWVDVDVPRGVRNAIAQVPEDIDRDYTAAEIDEIAERWNAYVQLNQRALEASIEDAERRYAFLHQWVSIGVSAAGEAAQGFPYGGLMFGALTGAVGLFLPQPRLTKRKGTNDGA